jgi:ATP-dependent RNA helicase DeaD
MNMKKFLEFNFSSELQKAIDRLGFENPTSIQEKSIKMILEGKDVIGESETGSGKTLAFGSGVIENCSPGKGVQAIILTPTRELAEQVKKMLCDLSVYKPLRIIAIYGGVSINPQIHALERSDVVVATPGRFLDHMFRNTIDTSKVKIVVLDEADRMFDMGFIDDVEKIIKECPNRSQTLFFSATISKKIKELAKRYMKNPEYVLTKNQVDPSKLKQYYYDVSGNLKLSLLLHLINKEASGLIMVFCNTRKNTDFVVKFLRQNKVDAIAIHGGFTQDKRTKTLDMFNKGKMEVLVCTDVAARGLHINNVSHIYNYDLPKDPTDYVHRIGRTARAGESGKVINMLSNFDYDNFSRIMNEFRDFKIEKLQTPSFPRVRVRMESNQDRNRGSYRTRSNGPPRQRGRGYRRQ